MSESERGGESHALSAGLRAQIARDEDEIAAAFDALRDRVERVFGWREWVRSRPGLALAGVFLIGFTCGRRLGR